MATETHAKRQKGSSGLYVKNEAGDFVEIVAPGVVDIADLRSELTKVAKLNGNSSRRMVVSFEEEAIVEPRRIVNLSAGCAVLPVEVLRKAQQQFVCWEGQGISVTEMGYRARRFHEIMERAEAAHRKLLGIPDGYEVHFMNGGATLQFAAIPMNLLAKAGKKKKTNFVMNGYWSLKAEKEHQIVGAEVHRVNTDDTGLYFDVPDSKTWDFDPEAAYTHYTEADTRQGFEFRQFPYEAVPKDQWLVCDASASLGSRAVDISKYDVVYAAAHKNFSTSGVCYMIIKRELINDQVMKGTPSMMNWNVFQTSPNKIFNVPVISTIWLGQLVTEWMIEQGGLPYFEDLAIRRSRLLYDLIDGSKGFYRTFVIDERFRSRMQVVFTVGSGAGEDAVLVERFITEAETAGWVDVRSHPLGVDSPSIRVTMYNAQPIQTVRQIQQFMASFMEKNAKHRASHKLKPASLTA